MQFSAFLASKACVELELTDELSQQPQIYDFVYKAGEIIIHHSIKIPDSSQVETSRMTMFFKGGICNEL